MKNKPSATTTVKRALAALTDLSAEVAHMSLRLQTRESEAGLSAEKSRALVVSAIAEALSERDPKEDRIAAPAAQAVADQNWEAIGRHNRELRVKISLDTPESAAARLTQLRKREQEIQYDLRAFGNYVSSGDGRALAVAKEYGLVATQTEWFSEFAKKGFWGRLMAPSAEKNAFAAIMALQGVLQKPFWEALGEAEQQATSKNSLKIEQKDNKRAIVAAKKRCEDVILWRKEHKTHEEMRQVWAKQTADAIAKMDAVDFREAALALDGAQAPEWERLRAVAAVSLQIKAAVAAVRSTAQSVAGQFTKPLENLRRAAAFRPNQEIAFDQASIAAQTHAQLKKFTEIRNAAITAMKALAEAKNGEISPSMAAFLGQAVRQAQTAKKAGAPAMALVAQEAGAAMAAVRTAPSKSAGAIASNASQRIAQPEDDSGQWLMMWMMLDGNFEEAMAFGVLTNNRISLGMLAAYGLSQTVLKDIDQSSATGLSGISEKLSASRTSSEWGNGALSMPAPAIDWSSMPDAGQNGFAQPDFSGAFSSVSSPNATTGDFFMQGLAGLTGAESGFNFNAAPSSSSTFGFSVESTNLQMPETSISGSPEAPFASTPGALGTPAGAFSIPSFDLGFAANPPAPDFNFGSLRGNSNSDSDGAWGGGSSRGGDSPVIDFGNSNSDSDGPSLGGGFSGGFGGGDDDGW